MTKQSNHRLVKERIVIATAALGFLGMAVELATKAIDFVTKVVELATAIIELFNVAFNYSKHTKFSF